MAIDIFKKRNSDQLQESLSKRLSTDEEFHVQIEQIASNVLEMMEEKTRLYGGDDISNSTLEFIIAKSYFEGVSRKTKRMDRLVELSMEGDKKATVELVDTFVDIIGHSLIALRNISESGAKLEYEKF